MLHPFVRYNVFVAGTNSSAARTAAEHIARTLLWSRNFNRVDTLFHADHAVETVDGKDVQAEVSALGVWDDIVQDVKVMSGYYRNLTFAVQVDSETVAVVRRGKNISPVSA